MYDRVYGALLGAAIGDAMGAATEARTPEQIISIFGHPVTTFEKPPMDAIGAGSEAGQVTDDFSCAYFLASHIVKNQGVISQKVAENAIVDWSDHEVFYTRFAGPSTRRAVAKMKGTPYAESTDFVNYPSWATNGSAMRITPIGLFNPGNIDQAIKDAVTVTLPTHANQLSVSGACAAAAAISRALEPGADVYEIIRAGLYGAEEGERLGKQVGTIVPGASVVRRMKLAVEIGFSLMPTEKKIAEIADRIGSGLHISEAVPAAFGLFAAFAGDPMGAITGAVNIGYDTDTVATIAGGICGAFKGKNAFPEGYSDVIDQMNGFDLDKLARDILETNQLYRDGGKGLIC